jgi:hypothetical protein
LPTLKKKASRYGQPDRPYLIAVLCDNVVANDGDIEAAIYGRRSVNFARTGGETYYWGRIARETASGRPSAVPVCPRS